MDDLLGHPVAGASWEAYVVENLISCLPLGVTACFYRTAAGAEIDLVIEPNDKNRHAIEIKRSLSPSVSKGFYHGCEDINAAYCYFVYPGMEKYPIGNNVMVMPLLEMMETLRVINP